MKSHSYLKLRFHKSHILMAFVASILALGLASCATTGGPATKLPAYNPCFGWSPIYPSKQDVLTDGTAKQILAHDEHGVQISCWKAPKAAGGR